MVFRSFGAASALVAAWVVFAPVSAAAETAPKEDPSRGKPGPASVPAKPTPGNLGPGKGTGARRAPGGTQPEASPDAAAQKPTTKPTAASRPKTHKRGRPPHRPKTTLPAGAPPQPTDDDARRQVAGGPTDDDRAKGKDDPELRELKDAERVLFPKPLRGIRPGWDWSLPGSSSSPRVDASGLPPGSPKSSLRSSSSSVKESKWLAKLTMPNLPVRLDARVVKYLEFYKNDPRGRRIAHVWARKSGRFTPALKSELAKAGLPTDLVWLSLIESGHNPTIRSPAGAAGLWQFIPDSGRMYGLTVDRWVDERLDPKRATDAAIRYLKDLRSRFGNWELAMAGYNMGHGGLLRAVRKFNTNDFWALSRYEAGVPWETALYVPKILAIAIVMNNKKAFGIDQVTADAPISFDTVYVDQGVPLSEVARAARVPEADVLALNGHYLAGRTPPFARGKKAKHWAVRVPTGKGTTVSKALSKRRPSAQRDRYVVRFGDTLAAIAAERNTSERRLAQLNDIARSERLREGTILMLPSGAATSVVTAPTKEVVVVPSRRFRYSDRKRVFYKVLVGDTLGAVARAFGVTSSQLVTWNSLDASARLQTDMWLQAYVRKDAELSRVRYVQSNEARVLVAGTKEFFDYFEGRNGRKRITVIARQDDTLSKIGKRHGMSTGMMERINRFSRRKKLSAGDQVIVYTKNPGVAAQSPASSVEPAPLSAITAPRPDVLPSVRGAASSPPNGSRSIRP